MWCFESLICYSTDAVRVVKGLYVMDELEGMEGI